MMHAEMLPIYCLFLFSVVINRASASGVQCGNQSYLDAEENICMALPSNFTILFNATKYVAAKVIKDDGVVSVGTTLFSSTLYIKEGTFQSGNFLYLQLNSDSFKFLSTGGVTSDIFFVTDGNEDVFQALEYTIEASVDLDPGYYESSIQLMTSGGPPDVPSVNFSVNITVICNGTECFYGQTCVTVNPKSFTCSCAEGYHLFGYKCETDPCEPNPCQYSGTCSIVSPTEYTCQCSEGYTGQNCNIDINDCVKITCGAGQFCYDLINEYECRSECPMSHQYLDVGENTCKPLPSNFTILFNATKYETAFSIAEGSVVSVGTTLFESTLYINESTFQSGNFLYLQLNSDLFKFLSTGGQTSDIYFVTDGNKDVFQALDYKIEASVDLDIGYYESAIQLVTFGGPPDVPSVDFSVSIKEYMEPYSCTGDECSNGGTCVQSGDSFSCSCTEGYFGDTCQNAPDPCEPNPCHYGNCSSISLTEYSCQCIQGYTGQNCTIDIDDCVNITCGAGQFCYDLINEYECRSECPMSHQYLDVGENTCKPLPSNFTILFNATKYEIAFSIAEDSVVSGGTTLFESTLYINEGTFQSGNFLYLQLNSDSFTFVSTGGVTSDIFFVTDGNKDVFQALNYTIKASVDLDQGYYESSIQLVTSGGPPDVLSVDFSVSIIEYVEPYSCTGDECSNSGTCIPSGDSFSCNCTEGYFGDTCQNAPDPCEPNPCHFGNCSSISLTEYSCVCIEGYTGKNCSININDCININCGNGTCIDLINDYLCSCNAGYTGEHCEININDCASEPCINGICVDQIDDYHCNCYIDWTGKNCETEIDLCVGGDFTDPDFPCDRNGFEACTDGNDTFTCDCRAGFTGSTCDIDINECADNPCKNSIICHDQINGYSCTCAHGYTGTNCDIVIDFCEELAITCNYNGVCNSIDGVGYECICNEGYTGSNCSQEINECIPDPCQNGGTCTDMVAGYHCSCLPDFTGINCEVDFLFCTYVNCTNGGSCIELDEGSGTLCQCPSGFSGDNCEIDDNVCDILPVKCYNNATCIEGHGNEYTCLCLNGFTSIDCSIDLDFCYDSYCNNNGTCVEGYGTKIECSCPPNYKGETCQTPFCPSGQCFNKGQCIVLSNTTVCECDLKQSCFCDEDCTDSPINSVIAYPSNKTVQYGADVSFNCTSSVNEPDNSFYWIKGVPSFNTNTINSSNFDNLLVISSTDPILVVNAVNGSLGGEYSCVVFNKAGYGVDTVVLYVSPIVLTQPVDHYTQNGTSVELVCVGDSYPPPAYQWQKMNSVSMEFEDLAGKNSSYLTFASTQYNDHGIYRCIILSNGLPSVISESSIITVSPKGNVLVEPESVINSFNDSTVTLTCTTAGGPYNVYTWTHRTTGIEVAASSQYSVEISIFTAGEYECGVSNLAGNDSNTTTINVGPLITKDPISLNISLNHHHNVTSPSLTCIAVGVPVPHITWTHNNDIILNKGGIDYTENGINISSTLIDSLGTIESIITFDNVTLNHTGLYQCTAVSTVLEYNSVISETAVVLVQDVPSQPLDFIAVNISSRGVSLTWTRPNDNNSPITHYKLYLKHPWFLQGSDETVMIESSIESLVVDNLHPGELYNFTVTAVNKEGESERSESLTIRTLEEKPTGSPVNITVTSVNSTSVSLIWSPVPPFEVNGVIIHYNITWISGERKESMTVNVSALSSQLNGLEEYTKYSICIKAATSEGYGPCSPDVIIMTDEAAPSSPPSLFTVLSYTSNTITLKWAEPPLLDINGIVDRYVIKYHVKDKLGVTNVSMAIYEKNIPGNTTLNTTLEGLDSYTVYEISIAADTVDEGPSVTITQRTEEDAPDAPPTFVAVATLSSTTMYITWSPPPLYLTNGIIDGYEIQYGRYDQGSGDIQVDIITLLIEGNNTFNHTIEDLQEYIEYGFRVRAVTVAPGPYSELVLNKTLQSVPSAHPGLASVPVPTSTLHATSVILRWDPIPADEANGELCYQIILSVIDQVTSMSRRRRHALTNTLGQCLNEAGMKISTKFEVPGNENSVTVTNIAPWVEYSFTVAGFTDVGIGPFSPPVHFTTPEGVPSKPHDVHLTSIDSTSLVLTWEPPLCDNGMRIGYRFHIMGIPGPDPIGELPMNTTSEVHGDASIQMFTQLTPNSPYQVTICALTSSGCGTNVAVNQTTHEDAPNPVSNVLIDQSSVDALVVSWSSPSNRNGSFNISLSYTATQAFLYQQRRQNESGEFDIIGSNSGYESVQSVVLNDVLPFAKYNVSITAYNRMLGKSQGSSTPVYASTISSPTESSSVIDLYAQSLTATEILVKWDIPIYPNGPISYYEVCVNGSICKIADQNATHYVLHNLKSLETYDVTVQPVTHTSSLTLEGQLSARYTVLINTTVSSSIIPSMTVVSTNGSSIKIDLPEYPAMYNGYLIKYYGIIVTTIGSCNIVSDYGAVYSNPRPYYSSETVGYYIVGGWNNASSIPDTFVIGNDVSTSAIRLNGQRETYLNPKLHPDTLYCVLTMIHVETGIPNIPMIRYGGLAMGSTSAFEGTSEQPIVSTVSLVFISLTVFLLIGILCVSLVIIGCVLYRRFNRSSSMEFNNEDMKSTRQRSDRNEIELVHQLPIKEHIYESTDEVITKEEPEVPPTLESEDLTDKETAQANVNTQNDEKTA